MHRQCRGEACSSLCQRETAQARTDLLYCCKVTPHRGPSQLKSLLLGQKLSSMEWSEHLRHHASGRITPAGYHRPQISGCQTSR